MFSELPLGILKILEMSQRKAVHQNDFRRLINTGKARNSTGTGDNSKKLDMSNLPKFGNDFDESKPRDFNETKSLVESLMSRSHTDTHDTELPRSVNRDTKSRKDENRKLMEKYSALKAKILPKSKLAIYLKEYLENNSQNNKSTRKQDLSPGKTLLEFDLDINPISRSPGLMGSYEPKTLINDSTISKRNLHNYAQERNELLDPIIKIFEARQNCSNDSTFSPDNINIKSKNLEIETHDDDIFSGAGTDFSTSRPKKDREFQRKITEPLFSTDLKPQESDLTRDEKLSNLVNQVKTSKNMLDKKLEFESLQSVDDIDLDPDAVVGLSMSLGGVPKQTELYAYDEEIDNVAEEPDWEDLKKSVSGIKSSSRIPREKRPVEDEKRAEQKKRGIQLKQLDSMMKDKYGSGFQSGTKKRKK